MLLGRVIGTAHGTVKHFSMKGWKLLVVRPLMADGRTADGDPVLALDSIGAGRGEEVILTSDGRGARELLEVEKTPVRWTVLGIRDA